MDEPALRTLFATRASGRLTPTGIDTLWTLLDWESDVRQERYADAIRAGMDEQQALLLPQPPIRAYTEALAQLGRIDRRRVKERMQAIIAAGLVEIIDRNEAAGYWDLRIIHLPPLECHVQQANPTRAFAFLDPAEAEEVESFEQATPAHQRPAPAELQRRGAPSKGRGDRQRAEEGPSFQRSQAIAVMACERQLPARGAPPAEGHGVDLDGPGPDSYPGAPPVDPDEEARRFSGAPARRFSGAPARRFSGAPARRFSGAPARRFSGAPPSEEMTTDDDEEVLGDTPACAPARGFQVPKVLGNQEQEYNSSSSSVSQGAPLFRRAGAPVDPATLPWDEIRRLAALAGEVLKRDGPPRDKQTRHLVLTAAIAAVAMPALGPDWIETAIEKTRAFAKRSRVGFFRTALGEGIELADLCPETPLGADTVYRPANGTRMLSRLQVQFRQAIWWHETHFPPLPPPQAVATMVAPEAPPPIRDSQETAMHAALAARIGEERYRLWFASTSFRLADRILAATVPNDFYRDWIRKFRKDIVEACAIAYGEEPEELSVTIATASPKPEKEAVT